MTTISAIGSFATGSGSGNTTLSFTAQGASDLIVLGISVADVTKTVSSISGGGPPSSGPGSWVRAGSVLNSNGVHNMEIWYGTVVTTGAGTISATYNASVTGIDVVMNAQEFQATNPRLLWVLDTTGTATFGSTSTVWPTLVPATSVGELYVGNSRLSGNDNDSVTSGYTDNVDPESNSYIYNPGITASTSPTSLNTGGGGNTQAAMFQATSLPLDTRLMGQDTRMINQAIMRSAAH